MADPSRNDPCPCGSGKKYKRCCLGKDQAAERDEALGLDGRVTLRVLRWVEERAPEQVATLIDGFLPPSLADSGEGKGFVVNLAAYELADGDGRRWVESYQEVEGPGLPAEDRQYLAAEVESWFSVWEILAVHPGEGIVFLDLLTGIERDVREKAATQVARPRYAMLGRIVRKGLAWTLGIAHPVILAPADAHAVVEQVRSDLGRPRGDVDPEALRGPRSLFLATLWSRQFEKASSRPPPRLENTDGEPWVHVTETFEFDASELRGVLDRLGSIPGVHMPEGSEREQDPLVVTLTKPGNAQRKSWDNTVVAHVRVFAGRLEVETNSVRRADAARAEIDAALGDLARHLGRAEESQEALLARGPSRGGARTVSPEIPTEVQGRLIREAKDRLYATWPDEPVPALGGLTPREAASHRRRRVWRDLDVLLRQMESDESTFPAEQRFDVLRLRSELGMDG